MYKGPERRKHPRLAIGFIVSHRIKDSSDAYDLSQTKNISQGGMLLTTSRQYTPHSHLEMILRFPFVSRKVKVTGEVLDSKEVVTNLIYATRIQFLSLEAGIFERLGGFINTRLRESA